MDRRQLLLASSSVFAASALKMPAYAQSGAGVTIGIIYPMSGANAQIGVDARHAFEAALDVINNKHDVNLPTAKNAGLAGLGGAKVKLVFADHQGDPQKGRAEAERLITQDKVTAIVGSFHSSVSNTVSTTCERYGVPFMCADSSSPSLHRRNLKFFFRPAAHDEMFTSAMFDFLDGQKKKGKKIETISLFYEDTIFGVDSSNIQRLLAKERGYTIVSDIKYKSNSPSLTAEVQKLKSADADVLMPSSYSTDAILLIKTMAELGYKPKNIVAQAAGFSDKAVFDAVGDKLVGLISRASFSLDMAAKRPAVKFANDLFKARASRDLNDNTSRQMMALLVLADAIDRAKSIEGEKVRAALEATNILGADTFMPWKRVKFVNNGQNQDADPVLIQYDGKIFKTVYPDDVAVGDPIWPMKN